VADDSVDTYALTHNETSTGVMMTIERPTGREGLVIVDATSGAGGLMVDASQFDCYYFAPQKSFSSDGGLWLAICSPAAIERIESLAASGRWTPASLDLKIALDNSRLNQTYNTPALATIHMLASQIKWMNDNGGLDFSSGRSRTSAEILYTWAEASPFARPFVENPAFRSNVVGTIDFSEEIDASNIARSCGRTASSTPIRIANSVVTNCGSQCFPVSTLRTLHRCARASTTSSGTYKRSCQFVFRWMS
jgi:phosphoserine aminotransferase